MRERLFLFAMSMFCIAHLAFAQDNVVFVEAENFQNTGGWKSDQQFMEQMGSTFLLAHGLGEPVADAETLVNFPQKGKYKVWVRTRDWVATWNSPGTPGRFQIIVNNKPVETVFGIEGKEWQWQEGSVIDIDKKSCTVKIHDLTGFEGRCDAILFSADIGYKPNDKAPASWRRKLLRVSDTPVLKGEFDLVVVGGGIAGMTTAISAGRLGLTVALVHNRSVWGGNASPESRVGFAGKCCLAPYPNLGLITQELSWGYGKKGAWRVNTPEEANVNQRKALEDAGVTVFMNSNANGVLQDGDGNITDIIAQNINTSELIQVKGKWFADCTGDGTIGYLAGADYDQSIEHMGQTNLWNIEDTGKPTSFPRCEWALDLTSKPFPGRKGEFESPNDRYASLWGWFWESGYSLDPFKESERSRDNNFRAMYGAWDCLKNVDKVYPNHKIKSSTYIQGKRESRRLLGDIILNTIDLKTNKKYDDGFVPVSWSIDVHVANPIFFDNMAKEKEGFTRDPFIAHSPMWEDTHYKTPYLMPYRCLYSKNISNLFMAGRDVSVTHEALGAVRVQPQTGMMGELVGMAASLCKKYGINPREVYKMHLAELKKLVEIDYPGNLKN